MPAVLHAARDAGPFTTSVITAGLYVALTFAAIVFVACGALAPPDANLFAIGYAATWSGDVGGVR